MTATATKMSLQNITLSYSKYFMIIPSMFTLYNIGKVSYNWIGTEGFKVKTELWSFYVVVITSAGEKSTKMRAARAARSFFPLLTNNITAFWPCRLPQPSSFLKLPNSL